jgi:hypothetical protein
MKTADEVRAATNKELCAFWNAHHEHIKFYQIDDRDKFEEWCIELIAEIAEGKFGAGHVENVEDAAPLAKTPYGPATKENVKAATFEVKPRTSNAAGIAASWLNPEVAAARLKRNGTEVTVDGVTTEYKSVAEAFRALTLPVEKHIRFRMRLKASGTEIFEHDGKQYHFKIV